MQHAGGAGEAVRARPPRCGAPPRPLVAHHPARGTLILGAWGRASLVPRCFGALPDACTIRKMIWLFERGDEVLRLETRVDNASGEYVLVSTWSGSDTQIE